LSPADIVKVVTADVPRLVVLWLNVELASVAVRLTLVIAVAPDEVIAPIVEVDSLAADKERDSSTAVVVPPNAPVSKVEPSPVEAKVRLERAVASTNVPTSVSAPTFEVTVIV